MKKEKLISYRENLQKYVNKLSSIQKPKKINLLYEKILKMLRKLKGFERRGKVQIRPSPFKLEKKIQEEKKEVTNILKNNI